ncbi:MAG: hydrogenase nickel incorporation protein HypB [Gammaproteobacteria bacterium]|nr:hydrogenase nickel incorporation protein HypB [Gammaproteobacteria bacterium]
MCTTCGCGGGEVKIEGHDHHDHPHNHHEDNGQHRHGDASHPAHVHAPGMDGRRMVRIEQDILAKNQRHADANRQRLAERGVFALNLVSSPGSGKTTLLVRTVEALQHRLPVAVIEGDQQTGRDAERIRATGVAALQINTGKGCHLDAHMVGHALEQLPSVTGGILFIENVGNLVCPAAFDLGEAHKVVVLSVTEGEDKPLKYPDMFHAADLMLLNKVDLLPYLEFDVDACIDYARRINPKLAVLQVSATRGDGMAAWLEWIEGGAEQARSALSPALRERKTVLEQELAALQSRLGEAH